LGRSHLLDLDLEARSLAGQLLLRVVLRKGRFDLALLSSPGAGKSLLEARNEIAAAEHNRGILGAAALEGFAVDLAHEVDRQAIAVLGGAVFRLVTEIGGAQAVYRLVDIAVGHRGDRLLEFYLGEVPPLQLREPLEGERVGEIARAGEDLVDLRLILGQPDLGLEGRTLLALRQSL